MSAGAQMVVAKIAELLDVNKKMLQLMEQKEKAGDKDKKGGPPGGGGGGGDKGGGIDADKMAGLAGSIKDLITAAKEADAVKPASATKIIKFYETFANGITKIINTMDADKTKEFGEVMKVLIQGSSGFVKAMALTAILAPLAIIGALAFGAIVRIVMGIISNTRGMKKQARDSLEALFGMARGIAIFMLVMVGIGILLPQVAIGVLGFVGAVMVLSLGINLASKISGDGAGFIKGPLGALLKMARGVALFMLVMIGIALTLDFVAIGVLGFVGAIMVLAGGIRLSEKIAGDGSGFVQGPLGALMKMAKGVFLFSVTMVLISFFIPQLALGTLAFIGMITLLAGGLRLVEIVAGKGGLKKAGNIMAEDGPIGSLMKMAKGIFLFSLTMVLISFFIVRLALGTLAFVGMLILLTGGLKLMDLIINAGKSGKGAAKRMKDMMGEGGPIGSLMKMAWGILIFSAVMVGVGFFAAQFSLGALVVTLALTAVGTVMLMIYGNKKVKDGANNLIRVGLALVAFSVGFAAMAYVLNKFTVGWEQVAIMGAVIVGMGLVGMVLGIPPIDGWVKAGAINLILLGAALTVFSIGFAIFMATIEKQNVTWARLAIMGAVIVGMAAIGLVLGIPAVAGFAIIGAGVLIALGAALLIFSVGFAVFAAASTLFKSNEEVLRAGLAIGTIGLAFAAIGFPVVAAFVVIGAAAMVVAAVALLPISMALAIWNASGVAANADQIADSIPKLLKAIGWGMVGMSGPPDAGWFGEGLVVAAANAVYYVGMVLMGSYAMMIAAAALVPISIGLSIFKATGWKDEDSNGLRNMLMSVGNAFADLARGGNWIYVQLGIMATMFMGNTLASLAKGIQALANMTFTEYEWDDSTKKLEPKKKTKLTNTDVQLAAQNAATMITTMVEPLAMFGTLFTGGKVSIKNAEGQIIATRFEGLNPFATMMGIIMLGTLGKNLVALAEGTKAWATMSYWEYELQYNPETKMKDLRPSAKRKLSNTEIQDAGKNIASVIFSLVGPVAAFGALMALGDAAASANPLGAMMVGLGVGKNPIEKGIASLGALGTSLASLAGGVRDWATMSYWEYALQFNPKTGMNELLPSAKKRLTPDEFIQTGKNIADVIYALVGPVAAWGALMLGGNVASGPFVALGLSDAKNVIEKGIESLGVLGTSIRLMADGVRAFANLEFTENEVIKDPKTGISKLQPKKISKLTPTEMTNAIDNIAKIFRVSVSAIIDADGMVWNDTYTAWSNNGEEFTYDSGWDGLINTTQGLNKWIPEFAKSAPHVKNLINAASGVDPVKGLFGLTVLDTLLFKVVKSMIDVDGAVYHGTVNAYTNNGTSFSYDAGWEGLINTTTQMRTWLMSYAGVVGATMGIFKDPGKFKPVSESVKIFTDEVVRRIASPGDIMLFGIALQQMDKHLTQLGTLSTRYLMMNMTLQPNLVKKYDDFTAITERLAKIATPFEKFVKSFVVMAKEMGTFAKNFKMMTPEGLAAYESWTNAVVTVAETDFTTIQTQLTAMRDLAATVYGGGDKEIAATDDGQSEEAKKNAMKNKETAVDKPNKLTGEVAGGGGKIDSDAIANAIRQGLSSISSITVGTIIQQK